MKQIKSIQGVTAAVLAMVLAAPMSAMAEMRRLSQTELALIAAQVIGAIVTSAPRGTAVPRTRPTPAPQQRQQRVPQSAAIRRQAVLDAMNREREARGLRPLRLDSRLNAAADDRQRDMFDKGYFDHVSPDGTQPFVWVKYEGYSYASVGENLAEGYPSEAATVNGWMHSPGHRANLLGKDFVDAGVSVVRGSPTGRTNGYTVVALYGREAGRRATVVASR